VARADDTIRPGLEDAVLGLQPGDEAGFLELEATIRDFQRTHNPVVRAFGDAGRYLPIAAFRMAHVGTFPAGRAERVFRSSGTAGAPRSEHPVRRVAFYERVVEAGFTRVFGPELRTVIGYLPRYAEDSSLVCMMRHLARRFGSEGSAVFSQDRERFEALVEAAADRNRPVLVVGAAFGLLDLAEHPRVRLRGDLRVVETGGMKTHRRSISRAALHSALASGFDLPPDRIGGEYGMCELMSQAWAPSGWSYRPPPWMRFEVVDPADPDRGLPDGQPGLLAVTDLANLYTASHLLTEDMATAEAGAFTVLGRASGAALRGCNFLMERDP
jgi:hypothetical protein